MRGSLLGSHCPFFLFIFILLAGGIRVQIIRLVIGTEENWLIKRTLIFPTWILCFKKYEIVTIQVSGPGPYSLNGSRKGRTKMARENQVYHCSSTHANIMSESPIVFLVA